MWTLEYMCVSMRESVYLYTSVCVIVCISAYIHIHLWFTHARLCARVSVWALSVVNNFLPFEVEWCSLLKSLCKNLKYLGKIIILKFTIVSALWRFSCFFFNILKSSAQKSTVQKDEIEI